MTSEEWARFVEALVALPHDPDFHKRMVDECIVFTVRTYGRVSTNEECAHFVAGMILQKLIMEELVHL